MGKPLIDVQIPLFKPLWRRVLLTLFLLGWTVFELTLGSDAWAMLFGALTVFCAHQFFIAFDPKEEAEKAAEDDS